MDETTQGDGETERLWALSERVIAACIEVHRHLGPGLLESAYEICVARELLARGISFRRQVPIPVLYKGTVVEGHSYRIDFVIEEQLVLELKAVETLLRLHEAQVLTYLRVTQLPVGLLVNFETPVLRKGLRRLTLKR